MTLMEKVREDAQELDQLQAYVCKDICKHNAETHDVYELEANHCGKCRLNRYVAVKMDEAGLLGVNDGQGFCNRANGNVCSSNGNRASPKIGGIWRNLRNFITGDRG